MTNQRQLNQKLNNISLDDLNKCFKFDTGLKMKKLWIGLSMVLMLLSNQYVQAAVDLDVNTPAITAIKNSMQKRHEQLSPHYASGAIGLTLDGLIAVHDTSAVPLKDRQSINSLVTAENNDRNALYKEIANGNGHPEWQGEIRSTFALKWVEKAQGGWWVQSNDGWVKK